VQGRAWRQVFRNRAPLAARAQDVHQTVSNLAQVYRALITTRLGRRDDFRSSTSAAAPPESGRHS
jgi:hypothetical protein